MLCRVEERERRRLLLDIEIFEGWWEGSREEGFGWFFFDYDWIVEEGVYGFGWAGCIIDGAS